MASPVDEIVEVTQCEPALAQAVLDNVTDNVRSPFSGAPSSFPANFKFGELKPSALCLVSPSPFD